MKVEGKGKEVVLKHYDKVPFDIMFEYGCIDAEEVYFLGQHQLDKIELYHYEDIYENESNLNKACAAMETVGVKIDVDYTRKAMKHEQDRLEELKKKATAECGEEYRNGPKWLRAAFDKHGQRYDINPKTGNPIFDRDALEKMESPIAALVKSIRTREKYISTYYSSFLYFRDREDVVRANIKLAGTDTFRFSYSDPNLQNVPKEEDFEKGAIQVRKCIVPREDYCFVMIDFDQQEFRLMLDYAGETAVIKDIVENGADVHQATADMVGIKRKPAKQLIFGLLYGMGTGLLAHA